MLRQGWGLPVGSPHVLVDACCWAGVLSATPRLRRPRATGPSRKVARNFPRSVFDVPRKRWNCNDPISKFEIWVGELRATFVGNHVGVGRSGQAPRRPGATVPPRKLARNFPRSVFDVPRKRWNCNDPISKFERRVGELRATFVGNHADVWGTMCVWAGAGIREPAGVSRQ